MRKESKPIGWALFKEHYNRGIRIFECEITDTTLLILALVCAIPTAGDLGSQILDIFGRI